MRELSSNVGNIRIMTIPPDPDMFSEGTGRCTTRSARRGTTRWSVGLTVLSVEGDLSKVRI